MPVSPFRAVVWAAVSTRPQAARDISLPDQIARGQAWLATRGITEAHPPLVVPGESRQTLVSLSDAEDAIPQLKQLLDLAERGVINLCVTSDTDRFRGLLDQVVRVLGQYGCQLYSLAQPVELSDPTQYRYYDNDAQMLTFGLAQLLSHADIARFQRKRASGMAARVDKRGLPPAQIPFGYRRPEGQETNRAAVPVVVEAERLLLLQMKADYLAGHTFEYIADWLNASGVPGRMGGRWAKRTVAMILTNPFYAGILRRNMTRARIDPRTRKRTHEKVAPEHWIIAPGKHAPIWSWDDYLAIVEMREQRRRDNRGAHRSAIFSRLLRCEACDAPMYAWTPSVNSGYADRRTRYICSAAQLPPHGKVISDDVVVQLRAALAELEQRQLAGERPAVADVSDELEHIEQALEVCEAKRTRYEQANGAGLLPLDRLRERLAEVDVEEARLTKAKAALLDKAARQGRAERSVERASAFLANYDAWMAGPPALANAELRKFIDHIVCSRDGVVGVIQIG